MFLKFFSILTIFFYTIHAEQYIIINQELLKVALIKQINILYKKALEGDIRTARALIHFFSSLQASSNAAYQDYDKTSVSGILWKAGLTDPEGKIEDSVKNIIQQNYRTQETNETKIPLISLDSQKNKSKLIMTRDFLMLLCGFLIRPFAD